jgi:glycosyltransferase involved in cell wall biosynthesis
MTLPRVAFVVNGGPGSAMGERAAAFGTRLADRFDCRLVYRTDRGVSALGRVVREVFAVRPNVCYVLDLAAAGVTAAAVRKHAAGTPFVLDTGDAVVELGRVLGRRPVGMFATRALEAYALRAASAVVVRGSFHREVLRKRGVKAALIPDGVVVDQFAPKSEPVPGGRPLTIGLVGSSLWVPSRKTCYGLELVELLARLKGRFPVRGVMIGDGSGIEVLTRRAAELGVADLIEFAGRVPYPDLPDRLRGIDIALSTQSNDVIGNVRTTGKLPLYLAAGRFVLASNVGEAARVLPPEMLVDFAAETDPDYPKKLAERVTRLAAGGTDFTYRPECVALARRHFEYDGLARRVGDVIAGVLSRGR